jgi:TIR domain-containing protein
MGGIFISYRRDDSGPYAGRLRDTLTHHFGAEQVFRDIDSVDPGERFPRLIEQEVGSCDALLALIGPEWLAITDAAGRRRLDDPDDFVRLRSRPLWPLRCSGHPGPGRRHVDARRRRPAEAVGCPR